MCDLSVGRHAQSQEGSRAQQGTVCVCVCVCVCVTIEPGGKQSTARYSMCVCVCVCVRPDCGETCTEPGGDLSTARYSVCDLIVEIHAQRSKESL